MNRNYNIDLLKILSCVCVVGLHSIPRNIDTFNMALYLCCSFSVPAFYISFGYQLSDRENLSLSYILRKNLNILRIIAIWNMVICLIGKNIFPTGQTFSFGGYLQSIYDSIKQQGLMWQLWYLWSLIIIYMLLLVLQRISRRNLTIILIILIVAGFIIQLLSYYKGISLQTAVVQTFRMWTHLKYFLIGYVCKDFLDNTSRRFPNKLTVIIYILITGIFAFYAIRIGKTVIDISSSEIFYDDVLCVIWYVFTVIIFLKIQLNAVAKSIITKLTPSILGVYIIHPITMRVVQNYEKINTTIRGIGFWLYGVVSAFLVVGIIRWVPVLRNCISLNWFARKKTNEN